VNNTERCPIFNMHLIKGNSSTNTVPVWVVNSSVLRSTENTLWIWRAGSSNYKPLTLLIGASVDLRSDDSQRLRQQSVFDGCSRL